ncbi:hypothetical protein SNOUR_02310 [Streptomyces noursei ATCC 11455]|nr:hypothetical protein SNOUR_02310 [Streptomyces noursei ATCC 11455]
MPDEALPRSGVRPSPLPVSAVPLFPAAVCIHVPMRGYERPRELAAGSSRVHAGSV